MGGWGSGWQGAKKGIVERCLILSVSDVIQIGALAPCCKRGALRWRYRGQSNSYAGLEYSSNIRPDGTGSLWLWYTATGEHIHDCISLMSTVPHFGGRRWWFRCPVRKIRVAKLYLPPGATRFASQQAYDLTYKSCQESGQSDRRCRRLARLLNRDESELRDLFAR
jgi:hypothetical protein